MNNAVIITSIILFILVIAAVYNKVELYKSDDEKIQDNLKRTGYDPRLKKPVNNNRIANDQENTLINAFGADGGYLR